MKKRLLSLLLILTFFVVTVPAVSAATFTDVSQDHWAYNAITTLSNSGIITGIGNGKFAPSDILTRAQMSKLLVCAVEQYDADISPTTQYADISEDAWYTPYISNGVALNMYSAEDNYFYPDNPLTRGECALWISKALGMSPYKDNVYPDIYNQAQAYAATALSRKGIFTGYEDGTFRPNNSLTRAEAAALILRITDYYENRGQIRKDAANIIDLQDDVLVTQSTKTKNIIISADSNKKTVTFKNPDAILNSLKKSNILYIPPTETLPNGFVAKITSIEKNDTLTIGVTEPAVEEVVESIDISGYLSPNTQSVGNVNVNVEDDESGWLLSVGAGDKISFPISPLSYKTDCLYASVDMNLSIFLDMQLTASLKNGIEELSASAEAESTITAAAGLETAGSADGEIAVPEISISVGGIVNVIVTPKIICSASGKAKIDAKATITSGFGTELDMKDGISAYNIPARSTATFNAEGEVTLEAGPATSVEITLCKLTIPIIDYEITDGFSIIEANVQAGLGTRGTLIIDQGILIDENGASLPDKTDDIIHSCNMCIQGDMYAYMRGDIGAGEDVQTLYESISNHKDELKINLADDHFPLYNWHLSTGNGYTNEFELISCPHKEYKVSITLTDNDTGEALSSGVCVAVNEYNKQFTLKNIGNGVYSTYLPEGDYIFTGSCPNYENTQINISVYEPYNQNMSLKPASKPLDYFYYDLNMENYRSWNKPGVWNTQNGTSKQLGTYGNFSVDIDDNDTKETIEVWFEEGMGLNAYSNLAIYINGTQVFRNNYGSSGYPQIAFMATGDLDAQDNCRELYIGIDSGEYTLELVVIRYDGNDAALLEFRNSKNTDRYNNYIYWYFNYTTKPLADFNMNVDGNRLLTIKHCGEGNSPQIITEQYTETSRWSRKMDPIN